MGDTVIVSMSDDNSNGCKIGSYTQRTAAANQIGHNYSCAGGLPLVKF